MNLFFKLLSVSLLIFFSSVIQAQNYFVCDSTGNDNNLGRSETMPFKTYQKAMANFINLEAGGSISFCRGGSFSVEKSLRLHNYKCDATKPCVIGDYGDESLDKPIITADGPYIFNFENGGDAKQDGGYVVENLTLISTGQNGVGVRLFNDVDDVILDNLHIEGFALGIYSAGANKVAAGNPANKMNDRLIVRNSTIIKNAKIGFLGKCNDCVIENNHFENNGTEAIFDHNIYLANTGVHAKGIIIRGNTLYKSAMVEGKCQGVSLVGHGHLEDVLIEGNLIKEDAGKVTGGCWGISIDPGYNNHDESFKNIVIRKNKIMNVGGHAIGCSSCDGITIENNEIIDEAKLIGAAIKVPVRGENTLKSRNIKIFNNRIILANTSASGIWVGGESISSVMNNNITLPDDTSGECVNKNQASLGIDTTSNICKRHSGISITDPNYKQDENTPDGKVENSNDNNNLKIEDSMNEVSSEDIPKRAGNIDNLKPILETKGSSRVNKKSLNISDQTKTEDVERKTNSINIDSRVKRSSSRGGSIGSRQSSSTDTMADDQKIGLLHDNISNIEVYEKQKYSDTSIKTLTSPTLIDLKENRRTSPSPSIIKINDVIKASQNDLSNKDPSKCRASAGGKCLME